MRHAQRKNKVPLPTTTAEKQSWYDQQVHLLDTLLSASKELMYVTDQDGRFLYISRGGEHVLGLKPKDMIGKTWQETGLSEEYTEHFDRQYRAAIVTGKAITEEVDYPTVQGEMRRFEYTITPIRNKDDESQIAVIVIARDITDTRRLNEDLVALLEREREAHRSKQQVYSILQTLIDTLPVGATIADVHGQVLFVNQMALAILGKSYRTNLFDVNENAGITYYRADGSILPFSELPLPQALKYGRVTQVFETTVRLADGQEVTLLTAGAPIRDEQGAVAFGVAILQDISERKRQEEKLAHLASIVACSDDAITSTTLDGTILDWNGGAERLYGYTADEMVGQSLQVLVPADRLQEFQDIMQRLRAGEHINHFETVRLRKDGSEVEISITISPMEDANGRPIGVSAIVQDISERKLQEHRKNEFISMASHELKTPITTIKAFAQFLESSFSKQGLDEPAAYLGKMNLQINALTRLVNDMLDISRIQLGKLSFVREPFDFDAMVQDAVGDVQRTTDRHWISVSGGLGKMVVGDKDRVRQVVINLLTNAIKYSPKAARIEVHITPEPGRVVLSVRDYGIGIAKRHLDKLFQRFYRVYSEKNKTFPGLGIGLYISYVIVEGHGGTMWVESVEGQGSTFSFALPLSPEEHRY